MLANLIERREITRRDTLYVFSCPAIAQAATPGQIAELKVTDGLDPFLRRPISIFDADGRETFSLLVRTVGQGTTRMTNWVPGTAVDVLGPLGRGFAWDEQMRNCVLVAGGIGLAPMGFLAQQLQRAGVRVHLLFSPARDKSLLDALPCRDQLKIHISDDRTTLPGMLDELLVQGIDGVFSCGPESMQETVTRCCSARSVPCWLSMEQRMACGIGICLGCAIAIRTPEGITYKKVCKDGPVFRGEEVAFHEKP